MPQKAVKHKKVKRTSYSIKTKREVVNYAKKYSKTVTANHFNLNVSMVRRWVKASVNWITETSDKRKKI
ncbi:6009_t:CDS:1, partial [Funneliformis geosporum]